jgi:hypothetical protein
VEVTDQAGTLFCTRIELSLAYNRIRHKGRGGAAVELVNASVNAALVTKISFINAISEECDAAGWLPTILSDAELFGIGDRGVRAD